MKLTIYLDKNSAVMLREYAQRRGWNSIGHAAGRLVRSGFLRLEAERRYSKTRKGREAQARYLARLEARDAVKRDQRRAKKKTHR